MAGKQLSFALDVERVVDDIVLFCMLVGNDFLPGEWGLVARRALCVLCLASNTLGSEGLLLA